MYMVLEHSDLGRCQIASRRLNCGCCDEVMFYCYLPAGHVGPHYDDTIDYGAYTVMWEAKRS